MSLGGPEVFDDDLADDVRIGYRRLLEDRTPDDEATRRTIAEWQGLDADEEPVLWLALAAAQFQVGRLDDAVRARALEVIDSGRDLRRWEPLGARALAERTAVLARLRNQLTGRQPAPKRIRKPWLYVTDLEPGTVLAWTASSGAVVLLRVVQVLVEERGVLRPILEELAWDGDHVPPADAMAELPGRPPYPSHDASGRFRPGPRYGPFTLRERDPDWSDVGFRVVGRLPVRPGDDGDFRIGTARLQWESLPLLLERTRPRDLE
ncbi:hypothetical protein [Blastococcus sp. SYSU D00820]